MEMKLANYRRDRNLYSFLCNFLPRKKVKERNETSRVLRMEIEVTVLQKICEGQKELFGQVIDMYQDRMYATALRIVGNREDAQEVTQNAFVKCYYYLPEFRGDAKVSVWLYRIVYNEALTFLKQHKRYVFSEDENGFDFDAPESSAIEAKLERDEQHQTIQKALAQLKKEERGLISLFYLEELSYAEIVEVTGLSLANVKVKVHRAKKKLKVILSPYF